MSNAAFVLIAVAVIVVVSVLLWLLNRKPQTFMSSIHDFEREMKALGGETNRSRGRSRSRGRTAMPTAGPSSSTGPTPGRTVSPTSRARDEAVESTRHGTTEGAAVSTADGSERVIRVEAPATGPSTADHEVIHPDRPASAAADVGDQEPQP